MAETDFYVYKLNKDGKSFIGYGVTNDFDSRDYMHRRNFAKSGVEVEKSFVKKCKTRGLALELENLLKSSFSGIGLDIEGFKTESLPAELTPSFLEFIKDFDFGKDVPDQETKPNRMTKWRRLQKLNLKPSDLLNKQTEAAFGYTFADPMERFKLFKQLVEMRMLLAKHGIKDKKDLEGLLAEKGL